jgi:hypothetical protein
MLSDLTLLTMCAAPLLFGWAVLEVIFLVSKKIRK